MRIKKIAKWAALPIGLIVSGALVLGFSNAAFTAQTSNSGNNWSTGTVGLNNNLTKAMFDATAAPANKGVADPLMYPGKTLTNTIQVNYSGTAPADVHLYATLGTDAGSIAQYMNVTINDGTSNIYTGTLANLTSTKTDFASGISGWSPTASASKTYTFTVTMDPTAPNTAQGKAIAGVSGTTFTWDAETPAS